MEYGEKNPRAESCWSQFWQSGKVEDYLKYCNAAGNTAADDKCEETLHADSTRRPGAAGMQVR